MSKYRPYSRRALRSLFRAWVRRHAKLVAAVVLVVAVTLAVATVLLLATWPSTPVRAYVLGAMHAAGIAFAAHLIYSAFMTHERQAIWHVRGAWGEENTRNELKRAKRKRLIWGWVDSITLQNGDIDHLVVTRNGGLVAVDSKWRSKDSTDHQSMADSAERVRTRSQAVATTLLKSERGSHRARTAAFEVLPAVVLWGSAQHQLPEDAQITGIPFVAGHRLIEWLTHLSRESIDEDAGADLLERLESFRESSWKGSTSVRP